MKKIIITLASVFLFFSAFAQPGSEIYLFDLSVKKDKVILSKPVNITNHKGYDNQPSFHPTKPLIYYSSINESGKTDIMSHNYKTHQTTSVTQTPENEYSPTVTLDGDFISCIIQRENGAQDVGKYSLEGGEATVIINNLKVGYHVWADNSHLGLFVLGTPNTLHYLQLPVKADTIIAENIGRSLHKVPGESAISFIVKATEKDWLIKKLNTHTKKVDLITSTIPGSEDMCWVPDGTKILMSDGTKIMFNSIRQNSGWVPVTISGGEVLKGVTRMAISPDGKKIAVVVSEGQ